jgi:LysR family hydrogen peroxide-inducible transcriptional activator
MNINELRFIVAVAQEKNFRRAAELSFVSQPALSTAIQKLERELMVQIFERSRTEVTITPIGLQIVEQAKRALEEIERIRQLAQQVRNPLEGPFRLGAIYTVGPYLLPDLIPCLHTVAPLMPLIVEENTTDQLQEQLRTGAIDAAIVALPFDVPGIETRPLYAEEFEVVVPKAHRWAKRKSIGVNELSEERVLILTSVHCFATQVLASCPKLSGRRDGVQQGNSLETIRNMVASGLGITVLPASANSAKYRSPLLKVIPFHAPIPLRHIGLAWRKRFSRREALDAIQNAAGQLALPGITVETL